MPAELLDIRIQFRAVPIGVGNGGLEDVDDERLGRATEVTERILDAAKELFRGLPRYRFVVGFAGAAQNDTKQMWPSAFLGSCSY